MKRMVWRLFPWIAGLVCIWNVAAIGQDYLWPTDASKLMTSSFCEQRPRRYHAAIDIKTWNRTGYKIFAIEDGYVYRLRKGATGYGNAIYLKLKDGNFALYAHLDGFIPEYEAYMDSLRFAYKRNSLDKRGLPPTLFPVKKGQLLGYTGETGIGVPHLHFEIRDRYNRPINPLQFYKNQLVDNLPPTPRSLAVIPAGPRTLINFQPDTLLQALPRKAQQTLPNPIYLTGRAYLALRLYDMADGATNIFSMYRGRMYVNDSLVYSVQYDRFSYDENHLVELDKNFSLERKGLKAYHNFYRHPANSLPFYGATPPGGGLLSGKILKEGDNTVRIEAEDYFGNMMTLTVPVIFYRHQPIAIQGVQSTADTIAFTLLSADSLQQLTFRQLIPGNRTATPLPKAQVNQRFIGGEDMYRTVVRIPAGLVPGAVVRVDAHRRGKLPLQPLFVWTGDSSVLPPATSRIEQLVPFGTTLLVKGTGFPLRGGDWQTGTGTVQLYDNNRFTIRIDAEKARPHTPFGEAFDSLLAARLAQYYRIIPGQTRTIRNSDGNFSLRFPANALYDTLFVALDEPNEAPAPPAPYRILSGVYRARPDDQPMNFGAYVSLTVADSVARQPGIGLYYLNGRGSWSFLPADYHAPAKTFTTRVTSMETFAVLQDTVPPSITPIRLTATAGRNIRFGVRDDFSGMFNENQITVTVNGSWMIFTFDPEEDWVEVKTPYLPVGTSTVTITAADNTGNRISKSFTVTRKN